MKKRTRSRRKTFGGYKSHHTGLFVIFSFIALLVGAIIIKNAQDKSYKAQANQITLSVNPNPVEWGQEVIASWTGVPVPGDDTVAKGNSKNHILGLYKAGDPYDKPTAYAYLGAYQDGSCSRYRLGYDRQESGQCKFWIAVPSGARVEGNYEFRLFWDFPDPTPLATVPITVTVGATTPSVFPDMTHPIVDLSTPENDSNVFGVIDIEAKVIDNVGIGRVIISANHRDSTGGYPHEQLITLTEPPYKTTLDTSKGTYVTTDLVYAHGIDLNNNASETNPGSGASRITVITLPVVTITNPVDGSTVKKGSRVTIKANASDNVGGVSKVEIYVNDQLLCTDTAALYECEWIVGKAPRVTYTIKAIAYNAVGNTVSPSITVRSK